MYFLCRDVRFTMAGGVLAAKDIQPVAQIGIVGFDGQVEVEALRLYGLPEAAPALLCGTPALPVGQREFAAEVSWDLPSLAPGATSLAFTLHEVYLALVKTPIEGPAGVEASFEFRAAFNAAATQMMTVVLKNQQAGTEYA